jgi:type III pantothenate kinase
MILAIDSGNTFLKLGIYNQELMVAFHQSTYDELENTLQTIKNEHLIKDIVLSVVGEFDVVLLTKIFPQIDVMSIDYQLKFPFHNTYETPHTLGIDRMVLSAGAIFNFPQQNRLVIDMGSCITYDFINDKDEYLGGAISPGVNMRYHVLNEKTAKLPLLDAEFIENEVGKNTNQSIHSGVMNGILFEMKGFMNQFLRKNENFIIILTGGSAIFFVKPLKSLIFAEPNFLLNSLVKLFLYQKKQ